MRAGDNRPRGLLLASRSPGACLAGRPAPLESPTRPPGLAGGRKALIRGASRRTRAWREVRTPGGRLTEAFSLHTPRQNAPKRAGSEQGVGARLVNLVLGSREGESDSLGSETSLPKGPKENNFQCKDMTKVSREARANRAEKVERPRSWADSESGEWFQPVVTRSLNPSVGAGRELEVPQHPQEHGALTLRVTTP